VFDVLIVVLKELLLFMKHFASPLALIFIAAILSGCSKNDSGNAPTTPTPMAQRGDLLVSPPSQTGSYTPAELLALLGGSALGKTLLQLAYVPKCSIAIYHIQYQTVDASGTLLPSTGALMIPSGGSDCDGPRSILLYAHGTTTDRTYNIADLTQSNNAEGVVLAAIFAAEGYIVVAPNYVGYDASSASHPYLDADQQSKDMIDALAAGRSAIPVLSATDGGKLFVTGYSEGGFVAMATHRAMQAAGIAVTASAPLSGPYALSAFGDAIFEGQVNSSAVINFALLLPAYQKAYGNLYTDPTTVFESPYASTIDSLLPSATSVSDLETQGRLPNFLFSSTAPDPSLSVYTPATAPANLASVFAQGFGAPFLITNGYRQSYIVDAQATPDGAFPVAATGLPPANPANTLRQDLKVNDLRNWTPTAPVLLCGGGSDPTVFFFNTLYMQNYWSAASPVPTFSELDVDSQAASNDPYTAIKVGFAAAVALVRADAVAGGASDGGEAAVLSDYHAGLVAPFCISAAKSFFDSH
jgi:hypothetical protein